MLEPIVEAVRTAEPLQFWLWTAVLTGFVGFSFAGSFFYLRRARLIEDTPTANIRSAPQGYVELEGWALPLDGRTARAPLSDRECLWWSFEIARRETHHAGGHRRTRWRTVESAESRTRFVLEDETGRCTIAPEGATVSSTIDRTWYGSSPRPSYVPAITTTIGDAGGYRYRERVILGGEKLYALGRFETELTDDPAAGGAEATTSPEHTLRKPDARRPFILSTESQTALTSGYRAAASSSFTAFVLAGCSLVWVLAVRF